MEQCPTRHVHQTSKVATVPEVGVMLGLRTEMEGLRPFLDHWVKKQNLLPLIKEKGEFVVQGRKTGKLREPGNKENRETKGGEIVISFMNS